jgi:hypothetical protein
VKLPIKRTLAIGLAVAAIAGLGFMPAEGYARGHHGAVGHNYAGAGGGRCSHTDAAGDHEDAGIARPAGAAG